MLGGTTSSGIRLHQKTKANEKRHACHGARTAPMPRAWSDAGRVAPPDQVPEARSTVIYPTEEPYPFVVQEHEVGDPLECDVRGCDFWCLTQEAFLAHKNYHAEQFADADEGGHRDKTDEPFPSVFPKGEAYECDYMECNFWCTTTDTLAAHAETHVGRWDKELGCMVIGHVDLKAHPLIPAKPPDVPNEIYETKKRKPVKHMLFACHETGCGYVGTTSGNLRIT